MAATSGQVVPAQEAGRPQPQTTVEPPGGPFIRHSQPGRRAMWAVTGTAWGGLITQPMPTAPGYLRQLRIRVSATGGSGASAVSGAADAPFNCYSFVQLKDAFGTPLISAPGYEALYLIPKWSQCYYGACASPGGDIKNMPSYSAIQSASGAGAGGFTFASALPLECAKGYGVISQANAALIPTLTLQVNTAASVYASGAPPTAATLETDLDADFYWLPDNTIEPPGLGTTQQWVLAQGTPTIGGSSSTVSVSLPRMGGYLSTLILILRDSTGARVDNWPAGRIRITIDGVPLVDTRYDTLLDDIYGQYGITRDTGVLPITRRLSLAQIPLGLFETGETALSTSPGTLVQIEGAPWSSSSTNTPWTLSALAGMIIPAGTIVQGLPEL